MSVSTIARDTMAFNNFNNQRQMFPSQNQGKEISAVHCSAGSLQVIVVNFVSFTGVQANRGETLLIGDKILS